MPSGNVPLGTIGARSANRRDRNTSSWFPRLVGMRKPVRAETSGRRWYFLSFRALLTLVCLQVFVLLGAGLGLLISAQQRRAQIQGEQKPETTDTAMLEQPPEVSNFADDDVSEAKPTIRAQSPIEDDLAPDVIVIRDNVQVEITEPASALAASTQAASAHSPGAASDDAVAMDGRALGPGQGGPSARISPLPPADVRAPAKNPKASTLRPDVAAVPAPRAARVVNSARQPQSADSRHRTAVRKRRWENSSERRASVRGETAPLQAAR